MGMRRVIGAALIRRVASQPSRTGAHVHQDEIGLLCRRQSYTLLAIPRD